ncbi:hypothetical protein MtrunA17_Chr6g0461071 [Medicago truncatula]|uniref:Uncharacterized protein n=1 Tax=Medicago truncatula TaxID=3880 RepID=A0A396HIN5_MEDTR|nr:hypothetical protein MtrunA17_Chr6g0461071 [Medicago truncatula]
MREWFSFIGKVMKSVGCGSCWRLKHNTRDALHKVNYRWNDFVVA